MCRSNFFGGKRLRVYEGVKSRHALRMNSRRMWRPRERLRHVLKTAIRGALGPSQPCASVTADVHGAPQGVTPLRPHTASRGTPVAVHGRRNDLIASNTS